MSTKVGHMTTRDVLERELSLWKRGYENDVIRRAKLEEELDLLEDEIRDASATIEDIEATLARL